MTPALLDQAIDLMLYGMGAVFVFLGVLIAAASLMSWLVQRYGPPPPPPPAAAESGEEDARQRAAAGSAAAHHHRRRQS